MNYLECAKKGIITQKEAIHEIIHGNDPEQIHHVCNFFHVKEHKQALRNLARISNDAYHMYYAGKFWQNVNFEDALRYLMQKDTFGYYIKRAAIEWTWFSPNMVKEYIEQFGEKNDKTVLKTIMEGRIPFWAKKKLFQKEKNHES